MVERPASMEQANARIAELEAAEQTTFKIAARLLKERDELKEKLERTERNRDMWRGQCERQAKKLAKLEELIQMSNRDD